MPCYRCGARQIDPARGASTWKRGVLASEQVLICPTCQREHDWVADLDRCKNCASTMLSRVLGETRCRECGHTETPATAWPRERVAARTQPSGRLAEEVGAALDRFFGRA